MEPFSGELMSPCHETNLPANILDLLVEYYYNSYDNYFISISSMSTLSINCKIVNSRIKQYGRLRIGQTYMVLCKLFVMKSHLIYQLDLYKMMSQLTRMLVKFNFFEHTIYLNNKSTTHSLALVKWYKPVKDHKIRYYCQVDDDDIKIL